MVKEWEKLGNVKSKVLVLTFLTHSEQIKYMRATLASIIKHCLSLPS